MIFDIIFQKQIKIWEAQIEKLYKEIVDLKNKYKESTQLLISQKMRNKRIEYLINEKQKYGINIRIEQTSKGVEVLTYLNLEEGEIELFNIDCVHYAERRVLVLWFQKTDGSIKIQDIQGGSGLGHGSVAMKHLIKFAKDFKVTRIVGDISPVDDDHIDRLFAFYTKNGFIVDKELRKVEKIL